MPSSRQKVLDYLVNNHSIVDPASPTQIIDGTGISRSTVYRLLQTKRDSDEETITAGIFISPHTQQVYGQKTVLLYYADLDRIKESKSINEITETMMDRLVIPTVDTFKVSPVQMTGSYALAVKHERDTMFAVLDSISTMAQVHEAVIAHGKLKFALEWDHFVDYWNQCKANYEGVMQGTEVRDDKLWDDFQSILLEWRQALARVVMGLDIILQDEKTGSLAMFAPDRPIPPVGPPLLKRVK